MRQKFGPQSAYDENRQTVHCAYERIGQIVHCIVKREKINPRSGQDPVDSHTLEFQ